MKIQDGTGSGRLAQVTTSNRLLVDSVASPISAQANKEGDGYLLHTGKMSPTAGGLRTILYFKNTSATDSVFVDRIELTNNGGNVLGNRILLATYHASLAEPTANTAALPATNTNTTSGNEIEATMYQWDGVGTGMTLAHTGLDLYHQYSGAGIVGTETETGLILGPSAAVGISVTVDETTDMYVNVFCHIVRR